MPSWVQQGYEEYAKRMPLDCRLVLKEIPSRFRGKKCDVARLLRDEGQRMLAAVPKGARIIALDPGGRAHSTATLAKELERWRTSGADVALLVGGPEGLSPECLSACSGRWSLSGLTFPHPLVRVILAESLYRAWSVTANHPYHRA